jgi:hypothetical protein
LIEFPFPAEFLETRCGETHPAASRGCRGTIMSDAQEVREEGFYWVILGQNPPEIATGNVANGGLPVMPSPGNRMR